MNKIGSITFFDTELDYYNSTEDLWFRATDIAQMLNYIEGEVCDVLKYVDDIEVKTIENQYFISEVGMYDICLRSSSIKARRISTEIKRLLTHLRKTGHLKTFSTFHDMMEQLENNIASEEFLVETKYDD